MLSLDETCLSRYFGIKYYLAPALLRSFLFVNP